MKFKALALGLLCAAVAGSANAQPAAPAAITIGTLYASSGPYASISMPVFDAFKLWVDQTNAAGGVEVKAFGKKIPIKLVAYDDQSSTATAATTRTNAVMRKVSPDMALSPRQPPKRPGPAE